MSNRKEEIEKRLETLRGQLKPVPIGRKIEQRFGDVDARTKVLEEIRRLEKELESEK